MSDTRRADDHRPHSPYPHHAPAPQPPITLPEINANAGIQVALAVLALAALPISAWLYISTYVESEVDTAIARHDRLLQNTISSQSDKIENLQTYQTQLCQGVRKVDPQFSCLSREQFRYRYNYQPYQQLQPYPEQQLPSLDLTIEGQ